MNITPESGKDKHGALRASREEWLVQALGGNAISVQSLAPFVGDRDYRVRSWAAISLGELGDHDAGPYLLRLVRDASRWVRPDAIEALANLRFIAAVPDIVDVLLHDKYPLARVAAAEALGDLGVSDANVRHALVTAVQRDRAALVRAYAAESLGRLGYSDEASMLRQVLVEERSSRVRASLLEALSRLGDPGALDDLIAMLKNTKSFELREAILNMLEYLEQDKPNFDDSIQKAFADYRNRFSREEEDKNFRSWLQRRGISPPQA